MVNLVLVYKFVFNYLNINKLIYTCNIILSSKLYIYKCIYNYQGGKDAASARYIFTYLSKITRLIFKKADDNILEYLNDDGQMIEPNWYIYGYFF